MAKLSASITLDNGSVLKGAVNATHTAKAAELTLDGASSWNVTADSYLTCLTDPTGISGTSVSNVTGNGHTVYCDAAACTALSGGTYSLDNGGYLEPGS